MLGSVMMDLAGLSLTNEEKQALILPQTGGVILFSRNYESPQQLRELTDSIHALRDPHLLIAVDQEGGRVQRFRDGLTRLPPVQRLGELYNQHKKAALQAAETSGWLMASEMRALGVDISFAPVLDLDRGISGVIGDRAFHTDPDAVTDLAQAYIRGMSSAGMAATGKHFPGHGAVAEDSHTDLPVDRREWVDIEMEDVLPFSRLFHSGLPAVMMAHVIYPLVDKQLAGFSPVWIRQILRQEMGFQGVVFSDDLNMTAADQAGSYSERARQALAAGCDMVLICNNPQARHEILEGLTDAPDPVSHLRLIRLHGKHDISLQQLHTHRRWKQAVERIHQVDPEPWLDMDME